MTTSDRIAWLEARRRAHDAPRCLGAETVGLAVAVGRVLDAPVEALLDLPHFDSAAMDGWVVAGPGPWLLRGPASDDGSDLRLGDARSIVTGGAIPPGGTRVIRSEYARVALGRLLESRTDASDHIRRAGAEARQGECLILPGTRLTPAHVALAASAGWDDLAVRRRPRAAILLTGDEVEPTGIPRPGRVRDSFGPTLPGILEALGAEATAPRRLSDDRDATIAAIRDADADLVVTTGGTGGSGADHLRATLAVLGADLVIPGLACRPGGPTLLARLPDGRIVLGLPGNPLAAFLALALLGDAVTSGFLGIGLDHVTTAPVPASVTRHPTATRLVPIRGDEGEVAWTGSAMMRGLAGASGVLVVPSRGEGALLTPPWT